METALLSLCTIVFLLLMFFVWIIKSTYICTNCNRSFKYSEIKSEYIGWGEEVDTCPYCGCSELKSN